MLRNHVRRIQKHGPCEWLLLHRDLKAQQPYLEFVEQPCVLLCPIVQSLIDAKGRCQDRSPHNVSPFAIAERERKVLPLLHRLNARTLQK